MNSLRLRFLLPVTFGLLAVVPACSGDAESSLGGATVDASSEAASDAPVDSTTDAPVDSAPDASTAADSSSDSSNDVLLGDSSVESATPDSAPDAPVDAPMADSAADVVSDSGYSLPKGRLCPASYKTPTSTGNLADPKLTESSGVVASRSNDSVLWLHNDSGDSARLYATSTDGSALGHLNLSGVSSVDWEDIALAPCPDFSGPCLWIADVGNNTTSRDTFPIYIVPEPVFSKSLGDIVVKDFWTIKVKYPDDAVNSEAFMVAPDLSSLYLIEKIDAASARVFKASGPFSKVSSPLVLTELVTFLSPGLPIDKGRMITGADMHPSGSRFVLRTYTGIYEYLLPKAGDLSQLATIVPKLVVLGPLSESQGEAVGYDAVGSGIWSVSEDTNGKPGQPLHHYACSVDDQPSP